MMSIFLGALVFANIEVIIMNIFYFIFYCLCVVHCLCVCWILDVKYI